MITPFPKHPPAAPAEAGKAPVKRPDPALLADLRARIQRLERSSLPADGDPGVFTLGTKAIDDALPHGGLDRAALHEIVGPPGAASGFCAALLHRLGHTLRRERQAVLWCRWHHDLHGAGLAGFGLDPARLLLVRGRRDADILWAMEEGLRSGVPAAVVGDVAATPPIALRRLQLAAETGTTTGLLLRASPRGEHGASPAMTRWRVSALPGGLAGGLARPLAPRWRLELLRCRGGRPGAWDVVWDRDGSTAGTFTVLPAATDIAVGTAPAVVRAS